MRKFRDWLRSNPDDLRLYSDAKRELSLLPLATVQDYANAKSRVVTKITERITRATTAKV